MKGIYLNYVFAILAITLLVSCNNDSDGLANAPNPQMSSNLKNDIALIAELGFDTTAIEETETHYIVENDILLEKKNGDISLRQSQYSSLVSFNKVSNIKLKIDDILGETGTDATWISAIYDAINKWNIVYGSNVYISATTDSYDILISKGYIFNNNVIAQASWPSNGDPGKTITINTNGRYEPRLIQTNTMIKMDFN